MSDKKRVVITGAGIVSPIGIGRDEFWDGIAAGKSGVSKIDLLSGSALPGHVAGECKEFTDSSAKKQYLTAQRKSIKVMCREIQLGVASAHLALANSELDIAAIDHERLGVDFGANQMFSTPDVLSEGVFRCDEDRKFNFDRWGDEGLAGMEPLWLLKYLPNMPACHIGIHADARGPNNSLTLAEASGNSAMGEAFGIISTGRADMMLAGSTGSRIQPTKCLHAALWDEMASYEDADPATWSRPFDASRRGQVAGEGACTFVFEEEEHAKARGASIFGEVLSQASCCAINVDGTPRIKDALVGAISKALQRAGVSPSDIGHINAHGLGGTQADIDEALAIHEVFGAAASTVPVTAFKSVIGNSGAACGTLELAASLIGLQHGVIPATLNYSTPDENCKLNIVHSEPLKTDNKLFLTVNVTAFGQAAALVACGV
ncbi:MAG: beta-ketoacyl-[acyl-carrier-protein] synthase family protein [Planctomycetota bacterium]|nr:beta-ketoacyl-[acyl-carrier-protein] synthase family protein [Planctomycetota bacterium]MDA0917977.1 beta-ketoacyl-[acyl-carrier-protein] synthase family protein [Planctomycetota bacterium]